MAPPLAPTVRTHGSGSPPDGVAVTVFAWNVNGAGPDRRRRQMEFIETLSVDLAVLTEVPFGRASDDYLAALRGRGLEAGASSFAASSRTSLYRGSRRYGVVIGSRWPIEERAVVGDAPWPERTLDVLIGHPRSPLRVIGAYVPVGSHGVIKPETFEAIGARIERTREPLVLAGDLNSPRREGIDEVTGQDELVTFGQLPRPSGGFARPGSRSDRAERLLLDGSPLGLVDVFRAVHGYRATAVSWSATRSGRTYDYRFDHVLVRGDVAPRAARYVDELRQGVDGHPRLSDHAAIEAEIILQPQG